MKKPLFHAASNKLSYRSDIDGLRAVAVLLVVVFHSGLDLIPGGFIGVDIFFVISGYLISSIVLNEINSGTFTFLGFYGRRIKRLLPAYLVVLTVVSVVCFFTMIPEDLEIYTGSLMASLFGVSNIFFSFFSGGYFSPRTEYFPLLHTWSLAVEEQFYLLWPPLLILLRKVGFGAQTLVVFTLLIIFSFISIDSSEISNTSAYYLVQNRAIELYCGCIAAMYARYFRIRSYQAANILSTISLVVLISLAFFLNRSIVFPYVYGIVIGVFVSLFIVSNSIVKSLPAKLLSYRPFVLVGLISYSLYLWHWPIFSLLRYKQIETTYVVSLLAIITSFLLASLTYVFVENPIRKSNTISNKSALLRFFLIPVAIFSSISILVWISDGLPQRFSNEIRVLVDSYSLERDLGSDCEYKKNESMAEHLVTINEKCIAGDRQKNPTVLLYGDSHANHFREFVSVLATEASRSLVYSIKGSCSSIDGVFVMRRGQDCKERNLGLLDNSAKFEYVVLASAWRGQKKIESFKSNMTNTIEKILSHGAIPIVLIDSPSGKIDYSKCELYKIRGWVKAESCDIPRTEVESLHGPYDDFISSLVKQYTEVRVVDVKSILCGEQTCNSTIDGLAVYRDSTHLNSQASMKMAIEYLKQNENPLK